MSEAYPLPPVFQERIRAQLGAEADDYFAALAQPYVRAAAQSPQAAGRSCRPDRRAGGAGAVAAPDRALSVAGKHGGRIAPARSRGVLYSGTQRHGGGGSAVSPARRTGAGFLRRPGKEHPDRRRRWRVGGLLVSNEPVPSRAKILAAIWNEWA